MTSKQLGLILITAGYVRHSPTSPREVCYQHHEAATIQLPLPESVEVSEALVRVVRRFLSDSGLLSMDRFDRHAARFLLGVR